MSNIEQKITEIKEKYTLLKGIAVKDEPDSYTVWLVVGNQQFVLDNYWSKEEGEWQRDMLSKAILALIASEQAELLQQLRSECDYVSCSIDTKLKGEGKCQEMK
jgi:hydroxymethylpyrimidine/phosphomethylpyrimidine kinase